MKFFTFLLTLTPVIASAQIASWDFTGESTVPTSVAEVYNANLDASNILTRGAGAVESAGSNSFRTQGFMNDGIATTNTDYFENTFSAAAGYTLSMTSIDARFAGTATFSATPGVSMQYAYSLDGTTFTLIGAPFVQIGNGAMTQIDLSGVTALQNVTDNITITIRLYASGQTATGGWGYNSAATPGTIGLAFGGTLTLVSAACNLSTSGLTGLTCNDNSTGAITADDFLTFNLNPTGSNLGTNYSVSVTSGTVTPTTAAYGAATAFQLQNGSAGAGDVTITITDATDGGCTVDQIITDPGDCSSATPVITLTPSSLTGFNHMVGTPSAEQTFTASGIALVADIVLTAPVDFEISTTTGTGFTNSINLVPSTGTVSATTIYVRGNAAAMGSISGDIIATSTGALNDTVMVSGYANDYVYYTIDQVTTNNANGVADSIGVYVWLSGVTHCIDFDGNAGLNFTLIDGSNKGINVFNFNDVSNYVFTEGDSLLVRGQIAQFNGLTQLTVDSIELIYQDAYLQTPTVVTALDETTESKVITLENLTFVIPITTFPAGSNNIDVTDGVTTFLMRIDSDTDIPGSPAPQVSFSVTGIGSQFDNSSPYSGGYQIFPCGIGSFVPSCTSPDVTTTVVGDTIYANATGLNYQWINCTTNTSISNEDGIYYIPAATGNYAVIVTDGECSDTSACINMTIDISGINESSNLSSFQFFPNPTNGIITIQFNGKEAVLFVTDLTGKLVDERTVQSNETVDLSQLNAGTYLVNMEVNGAISTRRLIIE